MSAQQSDEDGGNMMRSIVACTAASEVVDGFQLTEGENETRYDWNPTPYFATLAGRADTGDDSRRRNGSRVVRQRHACSNREGCRRDEGGHPEESRPPRRPSGVATPGLASPGLKLEGKPLEWGLPHHGGDPGDLIRERSTRRAARQMALEQAGLSLRQLAVEVVGG